MEAPLLTPPGEKYVSSHLATGAIPAAGKLPARGRHVIYLGYPLARNAGGQSGYLWHLQRGLDKLPPYEGASIEFLINSSPPPKSRKRSEIISAARKGIKKRLRKIDWLWRTARTIGFPGTWIDIATTRIEHYFLPAWAERALDVDDVVSVHCHSTVDTLRAHNSLVRLGRRRQIRIALTPHCPEIPADEHTDVLVSIGLLRSLAKRLHGNFLQIDICGFTAADLMIFPCVEAMEPYLQSRTKVGDILSRKDVRFIPTGIEDPMPVEPFGPKDFVDVLKLAYVGRHNSVKGYDLLIEAIPPFLERSGAALLTAGTQEPLTAPDHPRWREFGWIPDPGRVIRGADIFLLPNRQTFFDLVAIEAMAMGKPILASATGGNKYLAKVSSGIELFTPTIDGLSCALSNVQSWGRDELREKGAVNRAAYEAHFKAALFGTNYRRLINDWLLEASNQTSG